MSSKRLVREGLKAAFLTPATPSLWLRLRRIVWKTPEERRLQDVARRPSRRRPIGT